MRYCCLVMSERYIRGHFQDIKGYADVVEKRLDDTDCTLESVLADNARNLALARVYGVDYLLIDGDYATDMEL